VSDLPARIARRPAPRGLLPLPGSVRRLQQEIDERSARIPTRRNEYGFDPFGLDPEYGRRLTLAMALVYRHWFRVESCGLENVPEGRVLLIGNHAGNTFAWDGAMLAMALFLDGDPPRKVRGMGEYYLPTIPFFNVFMHRLGSVVGGRRPTASTCSSTRRRSWSFRRGSGAS
jgi:hypothetical protein